MHEHLRQIVIFNKTVDNGSFRAAAKELNLSPSVVSHHIAQLEEYLGVVLLHRSTRKLAMTPEGELLYSSTQLVFDQLGDTFLQIANSTGKPTGHVRVSSPAVLIQSELTRVFSVFSKKYPDIKLTLDFADVYQDLLDTGHDIGFRLVVNAETQNNSKKLLKVRRCVVGASEYLNERKPVTSPQDLLGLDWIMVHNTRHIKPVFHHAVEDATTIKPQPKIAVNDSFAKYELVRLGLGIAVLPTLLAEEDIQRGVVREVISDWHLPSADLVAYWPPSAKKFNLLRLFLNELVQQLPDEL